MSSIDPEVRLPEGRASKGSERARALRFSLVLGTAFALIAFFAHRRHHDLVASVFALASAVLVLLGLAHPRSALAAERGWMRFATVLSLINGTLILGVAYFVFLTPLARLARLVRGNPLREGRKDSYLRPRTETRGAGRFKSPY